MTDKEYIKIWCELKSGTIPNPMSKEVVEIYRKDFQGVKDIPPKDYADIAVYIGLN